MKAGLELVRSHKKRVPAIIREVLIPLLHDELCHVELILVPQPLIAILSSNWAIDSDDVLFPIESAEDFEELLEEVELIVDEHCSILALAVVIENVYCQSVESISRHAGQLRAQEAGLISEPALEDQDAPLEQAISRDELGVPQIDEVYGTQTSMLANRNVDHDALEIEFDDLDIGLVNQNKVLDRELLQLILAMTIDQPSNEWILRHCLIIEVTLDSMPLVLGKEIFQQLKLILQTHKYDLVIFITEIVVQNNSEINV